MTSAIKTIAAHADSSPANASFDSTRGAQGAVASPCISVCVMDAASGFCSGCLRSIDEIAAWGQADEAFKRQVLRNIAARKVP